MPIKPILYMLTGAGFVLAIIGSKSIIRDYKAKESIKITENKAVNTVTPLPTITLTATPKINKTENSGYNFANNQFDATATNQSFVKVREAGDLRDAVNFNFSLRNISVNPFIIRYTIDECIVTKDGQTTKFKPREIFDKKITPKAILPSEAFNNFTTIMILVVHGGYDSFGNEIEIVPSGNIRLQSCRISVSTADGYVVEPKIIPIY